MGIYLWWLCKALIVSISSFVGCCDNSETINICIQTNPEIIIIVIIISNTTHFTIDEALVGTQFYHQMKILKINVIRIIVGWNQKKKQNSQNFNKRFSFIKAGFTVYSVQGRKAIKEMTKKKTLNTYTWMEWICVGNGILLCMRKRKMIYKWIIPSHEWSDTLSLASVYIPYAVHYIWRGCQRWVWQ